MRCPDPDRRWPRWAAAVVVVAAALVPVLTAGGPAGAAPVPVRLTWMAGDAAPGTPLRYDRVGVLAIGPAGARNVVVLEPGTEAGSAYFASLARWIVATSPGWQVWSVERRENLLEDQSELNAFKRHRADAAQLYDYYLGYLKDPAVTRHLQTIPNEEVAFAKQWGMAVAVGDLRRVVRAAEARGGKVVLGGHSLGGSVVTAYATWDFGGHPGADGLAGLVYIDGGSLAVAESAARATAAVHALGAPGVSPWLTFGGIPAPFAGIFSATGSASALLDPNGPSLGQSSGLLPADLVPSVKVTNQAEYGYALNAATSPEGLLAAQAHLGTGISSTTVDGAHTWNGAGALTPISRFATMFSGYPQLDVDGAEWYFPHRLSDDTAAVDNGNANPAQSVLGLDATMGHALPKTLRILAVSTVLGGPAVLLAARQLARQSGIPSSQVTLVNRSGAYSHNDPAGAYPTNAFVARLLPFLHRIAA